MLATAVAGACAAPTPAPMTAPPAERESTYLAAAKHPSDRIWVSKQPTPLDLKAAKADGIEVVVNMRTAKEKKGLPDERSIVQALGMRYVEMPIRGGKDMTFDKANALEALMTQTKNQKVLLHCASGNRVGGLLALIAAKNGKNPADALAEGIESGLTKLEPVVKKVLEKCAPFTHERAAQGSASRPALPEVCRGL